MKAHELLTVNTIDQAWKSYYLLPGAAVEHLPHHMMMVTDLAGEQYVWNFRNVISYHLLHVPETLEEGK